MTTPKQAASNKNNAKQSTGPKSTAGKATAAMNAVKHGILSQRLFLASEDPSEFAALQDDLRKSLWPVGMLELTLVEKVAVALWRQRRLVAAETASIELARTMGETSRCLAISDVMGITDPSKWVTPDELGQMGEDDEFQWRWGKLVMAELDALGEAVLANNDLAAMDKAAPLVFEYFMGCAKDYGLTAEGFLADLKNRDGGGLKEWTLELRLWCRQEEAGQLRKRQVLAIAELMDSRQSAPMSNESLMRYQVALDGELYRALEALRKQQQWRRSSGIVVEAEVEVDADEMKI